MLESAERLLIEGARREGASWGEIGRVTGVTRQAARQKAMARRAQEEAREAYPFVSTAPRMPIPGERRATWPYGA